MKWPFSRSINQPDIPGTKSIISLAGKKNIHVNSSMNKVVTGKSSSVVQPLSFAIKTEINMFAVTSPTLLHV